MQFCEDIEKVIKEYTRPYRDPRSHKNHKRVMAQIKRISKAWRAGLRYRVRHPAVFPPGMWSSKSRSNLLEPYFVNKIQGCFLPSL